MSRELRKRPLSVHVRHGVLTIEIGVDTLATAAVHSPHSWEMMGDSLQMPNTRFSVKAPVSFARDVSRALVDELGEDGSSILTNAIDKAIEKAVGDGSQFFLDKEQP